MQEGGNKKAIITGVFAALAASSCCIPPVVAAIVGVGGASSALSWMEPFRPYLIGLAIVAIGYAWYSNLKPKKADDCGCEIEKTKWYQTKTFLIGMTLFAALSIGFPYYSGVFFTSDNTTNMSTVNKNNISEVKISIDGMTCVGCEHHVEGAVNNMQGVLESSASFDSGTAIVKYDKSKLNKEEIGEAIEAATGYKITRFNTDENE